MVQAQARGVVAILCHSDPEHLVRGLGLLLDDHGAADGHDGATMPSIRSVDLSLAGLRLSAGSCATATLAAIQPDKPLPSDFLTYQPVCFGFGVRCVGL